jgi:hypothetical protein
MACTIWPFFLIDSLQFGLCNIWPFFLIDSLQFGLCNSCEFGFYNAADYCVVGVGTMVYVEKRVDLLPPGGTASPLAVVGWTV